MANSLSASFPKYWSKRMQTTHFRKDVFREICNFEEMATLKRGTIVDRPYTSNLVVNNLGSEGSYSRQDVTDTSETLTINKEKEVSIYIRDLDALQSNYPTANIYADKAARALSNGIDGDVLAEVASANMVIDDADFGGTSGNGVTVTESDVFQLFTLANEKLDRTNSDENNRVAVLSPQITKVLKNALINRDSVWGDKVGERGFMGMFDGMSVYKSNALYSTYVLYMATQPTDTDTVTLNIANEFGTRTTITFTFKTTLGSTAGNVLIGGSADVARANLATLIGTPGTTTANGVALSTANQNLLKNITATNDNDADTLTLACTGKGYVVVGETLSAAADVWTDETQLQHNLFCVRGSIDLVIQVMPNMKVKPRDGYIGDDIVSWNVYGKKTFTEGALQMVDLKVRADQFLSS